MKDKIIELIYGTIDEINEHRGPEEQISKTEDIKFLGQNSVLDSLGLVNLIVNLEENINNKFNVSISIVDEKAMSLKHSPFRNVEALADYLVDLLNEQ